MLTPCSLPATQPTQNGDLISEFDLIENAWAECAAKVDLLIKCQIPAR